MKNCFYLIALLIVAVPVCAYQAGQANRTNFGAGQQSQSAQQQYRSFSNYNNRGWGQGVQTQGVQTEMAGKSAKEFKPVGKQMAVAPAAKSAKPAVPAPAQASTAPAAMPANMDPAAMMQQVQGMMSAMGNMAGGTAPQGQAGQNAAAMPAGMPDMSALMGGAMPTVPVQTTTPAKK